jgi:hypothetical protein
MHDALVQHHGQINALLLDMHETLGDVHRVVVSTDQKVSDVQKELADLKQELQGMMRALMDKERAAPPATQTSQTRLELEAMKAAHEQEKQQLRAMYQTVIETLQKQPTTPSAAVPEPEVIVPAAQSSPAPPATGTSPASPQESWQQARALLRQAKHLSSEQRQQMPALVRVVTRLQGAGLIEDARPLEPASGTGAASYPTHVPTYPRADIGPETPGFGTESPQAPAGELLGRAFQPGTNQAETDQAAGPGGASAAAPAQPAGKSPAIISSIFTKTTSPQQPAGTAKSPVQPEQPATGIAGQPPSTTPEPDTTPGPRAKGPRLLSPLLQQPKKPDNQ